MSAGLLLVTHPGVGSALQATVETILGRLPLATAAFSPGQDEPPETAHGRADALADTLDTGHGVVILTDAYGATPGNLAVALGRARGYPVVTGLNLPMLLRVLNYPWLTADALAETALSAARSGILQAAAASDDKREGHGGA